MAIETTYIRINGHLVSFDLYSKAAIAAMQGILAGDLAGTSIDDNPTYVANRSKAYARALFIELHEMEEEE